MNQDQLIPKKYMAKVHGQTGCWRRERCLMHTSKKRLLRNLSPVEAQFEKASLSDWQEFDTEEEAISALCSRIRRDMKTCRARELGIHDAGIERIAQLVAEG